MQEAVIIKHAPLLLAILDNIVLTPECLIVKAYLIIALQLLRDCITNAGNEKGTFIDVKVNLAWVLIGLWRSKTKNLLKGKVLVNQIEDCHIRRS